MFSFLKYCFDCLAMLILSGFGDNPDGFNLNVGSTGFLTLCALWLILFAIAYIADKILVKRSRESSTPKWHLTEDDEEDHNA